MTKYRTPYRRAVGAGLVPALFRPSRGLPSGLPSVASAEEGALNPSARCAISLFRKTLRLPCGIPSALIASANEHPLRTI